MSSKRKKRLVMVNNHFDLFWRRGLNEALTFKGKRFAPYSAIHDQYIKRNIDVDNVGNISKRRGAAGGY